MAQAHARVVLLLLCASVVAGDLQLDASGVLVSPGKSAISYDANTVEIQVCAQGVLSSVRQAFQQSVASQLQATLSGSGAQLARVYTDMQGKSCLSKSHTPRSHATFGLICVVFIRSIKQETYVFYTCTKRLDLRMRDIS